MSVWKDREGLLVLLVGVLLIVLIIVAVLAFAPLTPFDLDERRDVSSAGSPENLVLNVDADICAVEIVFSELTGRSVSVDLDLSGHRGFFSEDPPVDFTVDHELAGDDLTVDVVLDMSTGPAVQYDDPYILITVDAGLKVTLNLVTDVGDITMDVPSSVRLDGVSLYSKVGSVQVNLEEGVEVLGDMELRSKVGSVHMDCEHVTLSEGVHLQLEADVGSLYLGMRQTMTPGGNATIDCRTGTGSVQLYLTIGGDTAAEITSQADLGDIDTELNGFSGTDVHLVSDNHPDLYNLEIVVETEVGSIYIDAEWSE